MTYRGKKRRRIMRKLKISEISMVDRAAQKPATMRIMKRETDIDLEDHIAKFLGDMILTTSAAGHAHGITVQDLDFVNNMRMNVASGGQTSRQDDHSHPWIMTPEGQIIIGAENGHSHEPDEISKRAFSTACREQLAASGEALPDGSFPIENNSDLACAIGAFARINPSDQKKIATHIKRRAAALDETALLPQKGALAFSKNVESAVTNGNNRVENKESDMSDTKKTAESQKAADAEIAGLKAKLATAEKINKLGTLEKVYFKDLDEDGQTAFLGKSDSEQAESAKSARMAKEDANPVVYKSGSGAEYLKDDDPRLIAMAKQQDSNRIENEKLRKKAAETELRKRATEMLPNLPGSLETHMALLKATESIKDDKEQQAALEALKAQNSALGKAFEVSGVVAPNAEAGTPLSELEGLAKAYAEKKSVTEDEAMNQVLSTDKGAQLYAKAYN